MTRTIPLLAIALLLMATVAHAQQNDALIKNAMSAAQPSISADATIMGWPAEEDGAPYVVREGSNGWTCFPDMPGEAGSAMCLDAPWMEWADAWMNKREPNYTTMGFGYMLQQPSGGGSNSDPYATEPTDDNEWIEQGVPHLMIIVPDAKMLEGLPTDPHNGGPWVMWSNTPYVHIMAPMPRYVPDEGGTQ